MQFWVVVIVGCVFVGNANAHPHVMVDARSVIHIDAQKRITHIAHEWAFDEAFTSFAIQGLDKNRDGVLSVEELQPLAKVNVTSLKEYHYFTFLSEKHGNQYKNKKIEVSYGEKYFLTYDKKQLTLHFDAVLNDPIPLESGNIALDVYDPEFYVAFRLVNNGVSIVQTAQQSCTFQVAAPQEMDQKLVEKLAKIPSDIRELPPELADITSQMANRIALKCP